MNQNRALSLLVSNNDFDIVLLAGRYTLLDHDALTALFPICERRGTTVLIGGVFNSGVLNNPVRGAHFDYQPLDENWRQPAIAGGTRMPAAHETGEFWLSRAQAIKSVCDRHGLPLSTAALQFAAAHPVVSGIVVGMGRSARLKQNMEALSLEIPEAFWDDLCSEGLMRRDAPRPSGEARLQAAAY